jgi:hypothetical protein
MGNESAMASWSNGRSLRMDTMSDAVVPSADEHSPFPIQSFPIRLL